MNLADEHANAPAGGTVQVPAGQHGNQTFTLDKPVRFVGTRAALLGDVTFTTNAGGVTLEGMTVRDVRIGETALAPGQALARRTRDIRLENLDGRCFLVNAAERVRIVGGDWGPNTGTGVAKPTIATSNAGDHLSAHPYDVLVDGSFIHDMETPASGEHVEGILIYAGIGVVVRNVRFDRCSGTGDLYIATLNLAPPIPTLAHVLVENCTGSVQPGPTYGWFNVQVDGDVQSNDWTSLWSRNEWPKGVLEHDPKTHPVAAVAKPPGWPPTSTLPPDPPPSSALDEAWATWMDSTSPNGKPSQGATWRKDNPGEWAKLKAYREGTGPRPVLASNTGRQMVLETDAWLAGQ